LIEILYAFNLLHHQNIPVSNKKVEQSKPVNFRVQSKFLILFHVKTLTNIFAEDVMYCKMYAKTWG